MAEHETEALTAENAERIDLYRAMLETHKRQLEANERMLDVLERIASKLGVRKPFQCPPTIRGGGAGKLDMAGEFYDRCRRESDDLRRIRQLLERVADARRAV